MAGPCLAVRASSFLHPRQPEGAQAGLEEHPLNSRVEILLPLSPHSHAEGGEALAESTFSAVEKACGGRPFFYLVRMPVSTFVEDPFLKKYIRNEGEFCALSCGTEIDCTDVTAVTPDGKLHLAVTKSSYEQLGLCGEASRLTPGRRYNICIDLRAKSFAPGRKLHDRVVQCLRERGAAMEFLCSFFVDGICQAIDFPSSSEKREIGVQTLSAALRPFPLPPLGCGPRISPVVVYERKRQREKERERAGEGGLKGVSVSGRGHEEGGGAAEEMEVEGRGGREWDGRACPLDSEFLAALFEWAGAATCQLQRYEWPIPWRGEAQLGEVHAIGWKGLISHVQVKACVEQARALVTSSKVAWTAVVVWGFADAPVSWGQAEHGFLEGGENDSVLFIFPSDRFLLFRAAAKSDMMR